jgi:uncharacterized membrane protein YadS
MTAVRAVEEAAALPTDRTWLAEDWWSVLIGLAAVIASTVAFASGSSLTWFAVVPGVWSEMSELWAQLARDDVRYVVQGFILLAVFTGAARMMGQRPARFAAGFVVVYLLSLVILAATAWRNAKQLNLETPVIALVLGLVLANAVRLPAWLLSGFRAEFYIKIGVVLLGATLPLPVIMLAGPIAILQASIASIVTFLVIYNVARFLNLDRRLAAMLAGGGSICGLSAVIAIAGAVRAKREHISVATTIVVGWALVMIVLLPLLARAWFLPAGVGGAWIGTSEYADAAGFAAAQTYGGFARAGSIAGTPDQALWSYTLVKVVGRDMWIGIWAALLSLIAITRWEPEESGRRVDLSQIWTRFPKFILGFILASLLMSWVGHSESFADFDTMIRPGLIAPIDALRNWAFTFSFLSIGASLRIRRLAPVTGDAFVAFSVGVVVNLVLGFFLSAVVFASYWTAIAR